MPSTIFTRIRDDLVPATMSTSPNPIGKNISSMRHLVLRERVLPLAGSYANLADMEGSSDEGAGGSLSGKVNLE